MLWFLFTNNKLLVKFNEDNIAIPNKNDLLSLEIQLESETYIGSSENYLCYAADSINAPQSLPDGFKYMNLRNLLNKSDYDIFCLAGRAYQIMHWVRTHQFCGKCGSPMENKAGELARKCPNCGTTSYPHISPAVIVAITKEDKLLLASNINFRNSFYSVLAGFVEPGETLEQCVLREVKEEAGIEVTNIKYFGSQPWPFPDSLMIGFTAEYAGGEIIVDNTELSAADWYSRSNLPANIPNNKSIAGLLIEWFLLEGNHGICANNQG